MRIGAISDIHVDINGKKAYPDFIENLIEYLAGLNLNALVIPGDIAGGLRNIENFFLKCRDLNIKEKFYVPGNHDIWANSKIIDSMLKYREILPELCSSYGWHYLPRNPVVIDKTAFIGTMGWYDYSTANPKYDGIFTEDDYRRKINPNGSVWMDAEYARFSLNDRELSDLFLKELELDLLSLGFQNDTDREGNKKYKFRENEGGIDNLVFVSHFVPYLDFINFKNTPAWDFFGAFIGDVKLGRLLDRLPDTLRRIAFFGHTHTRYKEVMQSGVEAYCVPFGYPHEHSSRRLKKNLKERVAVVEVND